MVNKRVGGFSPCNSQLNIAQSNKNNNALTSSRSSSHSSSSRHSNNKFQQHEPSLICKELVQCLTKKAKDQDDFEEDEEEDQETMIHPPIELIRQLRGKDKLGKAPTISGIARHLGVDDDDDGHGGHGSSSQSKGGGGSKKHSSPTSHSSIARNRSHNTNNRSSHSSKIHTYSRSKIDQRPDSQSKKHSSDRENNNQNDENNFGMNPDANQSNINAFASQIRKQYAGLLNNPGQSMHQNRNNDSNDRSNDKNDDNDFNERVYKHNGGDPSSSSSSNNGAKDQRSESYQIPPPMPQYYGYHLSGIDSLVPGSPQARAFMSNLLPQMNVLKTEKGIPKFSQDYTIDSNPLEAYQEFKVYKEDFELVNMARLKRHQWQKSMELVESFTSQIPFVSIAGVSADIQKDGGFAQFDDDFKLLAMRSKSGPRNPYKSLIWGIGMVVVLKWLENLFQGSQVVKGIKEFFNLFKPGAKKLVGGPSDANQKPQDYFKFSDENPAPSTNVNQSVEQSAEPQQQQQQQQSSVFDTTFRNVGNNNNNNNDQSTSLNSGAENETAYLTDLKRDPNVPRRSRIKQ